MYWKVPDDMTPGWYYMSISAAQSQVSVQSDWIEVLPPSHAADASSSQANSRSQQCQPCPEEGLKFSQCTL